MKLINTIHCYPSLHKNVIYAAKANINLYAQVSNLKQSANADR